MKKIVNKVFVTLMVFSLIGMNILTDVAYATNVIGEDLLNAEKKENVEFTAEVNSELDIQKEENISFNVSVNKGAYLTDITVELAGTTFKISKSLDEIKLINQQENGIQTKEEPIKTISGNSINLNEIDVGNNVRINIPIIFNREEMVSENNLKEEIAVTLKAKFVDEKGNESKIEKIVEKELNWNVEASEEINQRLIRYIKYGNKTLVTFEIKDGIINNLIPVINKKIRVNVPKINGLNPEKVIANGKNIQYQYNDGILNIDKTNETTEDGKYLWNSQDTYTITYIYANQSEDTNIETESNIEVTTIKNKTIQANTANKIFSVEQSVGSVVDSIIEAPGELSKGYLYTSSKTDTNKLNTNYEENIKVNVGYSEVIDSVSITENNTKFLNQNNEEVKDITENIRVNKITVNINEITDILGESGAISVKDENGTELGVLDINKQSINTNAKKLQITTSKPVKEGNINITVEKSIIGNADSDKNQIDSFQKLQTSVQTKAISQEQVIADSETNNEINLTTPSSKASVSIETERLSTVIQNKNVVLNVVLNKNDVNDMLYTNPTIKIKLPNQITNIEIISAKLLYEEEITAGSIEQNGNEILLRLQGSQTQYNTSTTTLGALIRLETNITVNNMVPSSTENIELEYTNEYTGEVNVTTTKVDISAPTGFVATNSLNIEGRSIDAVDTNEEMSVPTEDRAKTMEVSANIINNAGYNVNGFTILGTIPCEGNKTVSGTDLATNINTTLTSPIETEGIEDVTILYSDNANEPINGNGWKQEATTQTKSYKIMKSSPLNDKTTIRFKYTVTIPDNLEYDKQARTSYGIYYNNDAQAGNNTTLIESKIAGIKTGVGPSIKVETTIKDTNSGREIESYGDVTEGEYLTYNIKVTNIGSIDAHNLDVTAIIPNELALVNELPVGGIANQTSEYQVDYNTKNLNSKIETLGAGQDISIKFDARVEQILSDVVEDLSEGGKIGINAQGNYISEAQARKIDVNYIVNADILENPINETATVMNNEGNLEVKISSNITNPILEGGETITYNVKLSNVNVKRKNNTNVNIYLPEGSVFNEVQSEDTASYDQNNNVVTVNVGTLEELENKDIILKTTNYAQRSGNVKTYATAKCEGMNDEVKSNELVFTNEKISDIIEVVQSTNIANELTDEEKLEYYIDIKNKGNSTKTLSYNDELPKQLSVNNYAVFVDGTQVSENNSNYVNAQITIPAGKTARVVISTSIYPQEANKTVTISNKPTLSSDNGEVIEINSVVHRITGTNQVYNIEETNNDQPENTTSKENYKIRGAIWFDENKNGKRDNTETAMSSVSLKLYNSLTKEMVKNLYGGEVTLDTNEYGEYTFDNLTSGEYIVIAMFNNENYEIGSYKVDGALEIENSDFVLANLDGQDCAASDVIRVTNDSIYNIDLGLVEKEVFDLGIFKEISKITVVGNDNKAKEYEVNDKKATIELSEEDLNNSTMLLEYTIIVTNNSKIAGYAKSIVDYLPQGMAFNSELNPDWYLSKNGNLYCTSIANLKINPGEHKEIKLVLTKKNSGQNTGLIRGRTEIKETYNEKGLEEINAETSNYVRGSNLATSDVIILKQSKVNAIVVIGISIILIALTGMVGFEVKKRVIDKLYNYDQID